MNTDTNGTRTNGTPGNGPQRLDQSTFKSFVESKAIAMLKGSTSEAEAKKLAGQVALAFATSMRTAKNPQSFVDCTVPSILTAIANAVATRLPPGGAAAVAYLVPQAPRKGMAPELQFRISHRGYITLALREGIRVHAVPVARTDEIELRNGEITLVQNPDAYPETGDDLRGVAVFGKHIASGMEFSTWVPVAVIKQRAAMSRQQDGPWSEWPIAMAIGAAIRYAVARGDVPVYSLEMQFAMEADNAADRATVVDAASTVVDSVKSTPPPEGLRTSPRIEDQGGDLDPLERLHELNEREAEREVVEAARGEASRSTTAAIAVPTPAALAAAEAAYQDAHNPTALVELRKRVTGVTRGKDIPAETLPAYYAALTGEE